MARLYFDEDAQGRLARALRELGHDVLTVYEDGRANQRFPDEQVLSRATELGRVVVTYNRRHYKRLHRETGGQHGGILTVSQGDIAILARRVDACLRDCGDPSGLLLHAYLGD